MHEKDNKNDNRKLKYTKKKECVNLRKDVKKEEIRKKLNEGKGNEGLEKVKNYLLKKNV